MQLFNELNENNFLLYAAKNYYNPRCIDAEEFYDDLNRFKYTKRLISKYNQTGELSERLILNHLIVIFNVFGYPQGIKMLEYKIGMNNWHIIKPFLVFLKAIRNDQYTEVSMEQKVVDSLRKIKWDY